MINVIEIFKEIARNTGLIYNHFRQTLREILSQKSKQTPNAT
jgi:hypothetical protein